MEKTKHPYLKDGLKTAAKVALIAGATAIATPYTFGFAAGFFNSMLAGYGAGLTVFSVGTWQTVKTLVKDVITMQSRVKKQQQDEQIKGQLEEIRKEFKEIKSKEQNSKVDKKEKEEEKPNKGTEKTIQPLASPQKAPKTHLLKKAKLIFRRRSKQYDHAA